MLLDSVLAVASGVSTASTVGVAVCGASVTMGCAVRSPEPRKISEKMSTSATMNQMAEAALTAQRMGFSNLFRRHSR